MTDNMNVSVSYLKEMVQIFLEDYVDNFDEIGCRTTDEEINTYTEEFGSILIQEYSQYQVCDKNDQPFSNETSATILSLIVEYSKDIFKREILQYRENWRSAY
jgi:hypothetical protein